MGCHSGKRGTDGRLVPFKDAPSWFRPGLTPRDMLRKGMHGGIYWNPKGGKPGVKYPRSSHPKGIPGVTIDEYPVEWFEGVPKDLYLSRRYSTAHNCYRVKSGLDQAGWESSGWITEHDPRGWTRALSPACGCAYADTLILAYTDTRLRFCSLALMLARSPFCARVYPAASIGAVACLIDHCRAVSVAPASAEWYFRFFLGRRLPDGEDERQLSRWKGVCGEKGRWKSNLIAKCLRDGKAHDDVSVSPVVRQTLLHWAYELTEADFASGAKRVRSKGAAYVPRDQLTGVVRSKKVSAVKEEEEEAAEAVVKKSAAAAADERQQRAKRRAERTDDAEDEGGNHSGDGEDATKGGRQAGAPPASKKTRRAAAPAPSAKAPKKAAELSAYE